MLLATSSGTGVSTNLVVVNRVALMGIAYSGFALDLSIAMMVNGEMPMSNW